MKMTKVQVYKVMEPGRWYTCKDFNGNTQVEIEAISSHLSQLYRDKKLDRQKRVSPGSSFRAMFEYRVRINPLPDTLTSRVIAAISQPPVEVHQEPSKMEQALTYLGLIIREEIEDVVEDRMALLLENMYFESPMAKNPERAKLKRVVVAGLLPGQEKMIKTEFGKDFNLGFYEVNQPVSTLGLLAKRADHVLLITGKISHKHQTPVRHHPGLIWVNGLMTDIRNKLVDLA